MEASTATPMKADFASGVTVAEELKNMSREQMIVYARDKMDLTVDSSLDPETIRNELLRIYRSRMDDARELNAESLRITMALDAKRKKASESFTDGRKKKPFEYRPNPPIQVKFYFMQHPGVDLEFANAAPYGIKGEVNKYGFETHPQYHLFHGELYVLPLLLVEELRNKTYVAHKPIIDPATGLQNGATPIIKPRFVFEQIISPEESILLAEHRAGKLKESTNEAKEI